MDFGTLKEVSDSLLFRSFFTVALLLTIPFVMGLFGKNQFPVEGKSILLTGASEGMGLAVAKQLAAKGANIMIVSRRVEALETALSEMTASAKSPKTQKFAYEACDVSKHDFGVELLQKATAWNGGKSLDIVWQIAGMSTPELFVDMELTSLRRQMDVNFFGTAELAHATLRDWLAPDAPITPEPKHLVMTTSVAAFCSIAGYGPYSPSKWAIRSLADTIRQEVSMYPQNVKVHVVFPGTIISPGWHREEQTKPLITKQMEESDPQQTPEECAAAAVKGLEAGHYYVTVSWLGSVMRWGALGGSARENWFIDTLGGLLTLIVWPIVLLDMHLKISAHLKKYGHPSNQKKQA